MLFNSLTFLIFLIIFYALYWTLKEPKYQKYLIFICSLVFYGFWRLEFLPLLIFSVIINYLFAFIIANSEKKRFLFLFISVSINLLLLFYFKYLLFFVESIYSIANIFDINLDFNFTHIILPLGISFYTFQSISYIVDIYRNHIDPEQDFLYFASYVTFFPQLVAGPILRSSQVIPQLKYKKKFSLSNLLNGIKRIVYGLFLKVVLADNIAPLVDNNFSLSKESLSAIDVWTLAFLFGFQIYFDFSAYSHIAIGIARSLGIHFPENFNFPYSSKSPKEFWKRWHISLSSWIKDYLYLPLTNSTYDKKKHKLENYSDGIASVTIENRNKSLLITWALMGLWHGANWTFLLWGVLHALVIVIYRNFFYINLTINIKIQDFLGWIITILSVMIIWIPFRTTNIHETMIMYSKIINPSEYLMMNLKENIYLITATILILIILTQKLHRLYLKFLLNKKYYAVIIDFVIYLCVIPLLIIFLRPTNQFIYFQF